MTDPASYLAGQTAIVTGASSGIGRELALRLLDAGVRVALVGRDKGRLRRAVGATPHPRPSPQPSPTRGEGVGQEASPMKGEGEGFMLVECDVTDDDAVRAMVRRVERAWGRVDILMNSAGAYKTGPFTELTNEVWDELWRVNVNGTLFPTRAVLPGMLERGHGVIVVLSSVAAHRNFSHNTAYGATKHAVTGLARSLSTEVRRRGVRVVNAIIGPVDTPIWDGKDLPLKREDMLTPQEVAAGIINAITISDRQVLEEVLLLPQAGLYP